MTWISCDEGIEWKGITVNRVIYYVKASKIRGLDNYAKVEDTEILSVRIKKCFVKVFVRLLTDDGLVICQENGDQPVGGDTPSTPPDSVNILPQGITIYCRDPVRTVSVS